MVVASMYSANRTVGKLIKYLYTSILNITIIENIDIYFIQF